jgi:hypothetical protein
MHVVAGLAALGQGAARRDARPLRRERPQGLEVPVGAAVGLQVVDAVVAGLAQPAEQGGQVAEVAGTAVGLDAVEVGRQLGQGFEGRGGQQRDLGARMGFADLLHRRQGQNEIAEGAQLDHQDLLDFLAQFFVSRTRA